VLVDLEDLLLWVVEVETLVLVGTMAVAGLVLLELVHFQVLVVVVAEGQLYM
jgi:hypothetical protein